MNIKIEGLPEGYKEVAYRQPSKNERYMFEDEVLVASENMAYSYLIVEKIKPRKIVLEEIGIDSIYPASNGYSKQYTDKDGFTRYLILREVKENDIPLNSGEPKLSLTKKDMLELIEHIKLGGQLNPKIAEFIDYEPKLSLSVDEAHEIYTYNILINQKIIKFIEENS
jgi:hypothetical protein